MQVHEYVNHKLSQSLKEGQNQIAYLKDFILKEIGDFEARIREVRLQGKLRIRSQQEKIKGTILIQPAWPRSRRRRARSPRCTGSCR